MSIISCLLKKAELGRITKKTAEDVTFLIKSYKEKIAGGADLVAEMEVAEKAYGIVQQRLAQRTRQVAIHADIVEKSLSRIDTQLANDVPLKTIMESFNIGSESSGFKYGFLGENGWEKIQGTRQVYESMLTEAFDSLKDKGWFGVFKSSPATKEAIRDMYAAFRGVGTRSSDPNVRVIADTFQKVDGLLTQDFIRAGGNLTARKDFLLGRHDHADKLLEHGIDTWLSDIKPLLNMETIIEWLPEAKNPEVLDGVLRKIYQYQVSGGMTEIGDFVPKGLRSVVNLRNHHRFINLVDADAYIKYHEKYGDLNFYGHLQNYTDRMARDVGTLNFYGPKPEALMNSLKRKLAEVAPEEAARVAKRFEREFRFVTGLWNSSTDPKMSRMLANFRAANTAGKLGATFLDAATSETLGLSSVARHIRGLPVLKSLKRDLSLFLKPGNLNDEYKKWAKFAIYNEAFIEEAAAGMRSAEAEGATKFWDTSATALLKYSGLTRKTHTTKGTSAEMLAIEWADRAWEQLGDNGQRWLGNQGITKEVYEKIQLVGKEVYDEGLGVNIISPAKLYEEGLLDEASKMAAILQRAAEASSPTSNPRIRAFFADLERSSMPAQFAVGSMKTFTGYPMSFWENHFKVLLNQPGAGRKAAYAGAYVTALIIGNTMSQLVRDMKDGKKPKLDEDTIMRAAKRSNVIPFITDFILSGGEYSQRGLYDTVAGATLDSAARALSGVSKMTVGAGKQLVAGDTQKAKEKVASGTNDILRVLQGFVPGQNHWATGLAFQRLIMDQLRLLYDPKGDKALRARIRKEERKGGSYWWAPGETKPNFK